ncbi:GAL83 [Sanghuangporus vaninii]
MKSRTRTMANGKFQSAAQISESQTRRDKLNRAEWKDHWQAAEVEREKRDWQSVRRVHHVSVASVLLVIVIAVHHSELSIRIYSAQRRLQFDPHRRRSTKFARSVSVESPSTRSPSSTPETPSRASSRRSRSLHHNAPPSSPDHRSPSRASDARGQSSDSAQNNQKRLPHRSLRTKKKSLELPDLALALTPAAQGAPTVPGTTHGVSGPYRRPQASSPIAIPARAGSGAGQTAPSRQSLEARLREIPSAATNVTYQNMPAMAEVIVQAEAPRGRGNPHIRGAPLQYSSTHSFAGTGRGQTTVPSFVLRSHPYGGFVPEDVHSSIPLALPQAETGAEEEAERVEEKAKNASHRQSTDEKQPAQVRIVWRGGGKSVFLMRAGDNNWKGRQAMEYDESTKQWTTWVSLSPGTHHIRFLVDGVSTIADDLPTAVDDNGTLANYVAVPISGHTPPSATLHPTPREQIPPASSGNGASFFADAEAPGGDGEAAWTDKVPWQLECAAEEEEQWLSHSHSHGGQGQPPPPQHPQAPSLPRHLEKLILNQKQPPRSSKTGGSSAALFGGSGMLPVTTASGTNLSASTSKHGSISGNGAAVPPLSREPYTKLNDAPAGVLAGTGNADDGSVLPVPSHVVLHHLGTSAIRNGVLAVADTVRYKKKYITTIYYKPT